MNRATWALASAAVLLAGCDRSAPPADPPRDAASAPGPATAGEPAPAATAAPGPAPSASAATPPPQAAGGPCHMQDDQRLAVAPLRAVGTEPFWGAQIEGRCVTYSHPDDQQGTRVWTRYTASRGGGGTWSGNLEGKPFVLVTRAQPGCSDGMSDRRYPVAVTLTVGGEQRTGCAEPR